MPFTGKGTGQSKSIRRRRHRKRLHLSGQDLGGVSLQPDASIAYKGLSLEAWGSDRVLKRQMPTVTMLKEFDLTLGYSTGGFSVYNY